MRIHQQPRSGRRRARPRNVHRGSGQRPARHLGVGHRQHNQQRQIAGERTAEQRDGEHGNDHGDNAEDQVEPALPPSARRQRPPAAGRGHHDGYPDDCHGQQH